MRFLWLFFAARAVIATYQYQDTMDNRIDRWLASHEHLLPTRDGADHINWADAELHLWLRMQAWVTARHTRHRWLDVGCGLGRILSRFGWLFGEAVCLEPDATRLANVLQWQPVRAELWDVARRAGDLPQMRVRKVREHLIHSRFLEARLPGVQIVEHADSRSAPPKLLSRGRRFATEAVGPTATIGPNGTFDVVSTIHVIQHIPTHEVKRWLVRVRAPHAPCGQARIWPFSFLQCRILGHRDHTVYGTPMRPLPRRPHPVAHMNMEMNSVATLTVS